MTSSQLQQDIEIDEILELQARSLSAGSDVADPNRSVEDNCVGKRVSDNWN